jgi:hypothetical protein
MDIVFIRRDARTVISCNTHAKLNSLKAHSTCYLRQLQGDALQVHPVARVAALFGAVNVGPHCYYMKRRVQSDRSVVENFKGFCEMTAISR